MVLMASYKSTSGTVERGSTLSAVPQDEFFKAGRVVAELAKVVQKDTPDQGSGYVGFLLERLTWFHLTNQPFNAEQTIGQINSSKNKLVNPAAATLAVSFIRLLQPGVDLNRIPEMAKNQFS